MKHIEHIFFDLDNTLWDFNRNSAEVLAALHDQFELVNKGIPTVGDFVERYHVHNDRAWKAYREGLMDKETLRWERYWRTLADFGHDNRKLAMDLSGAYLDNLGDKNNLMPGARDLLDALHSSYTLHIITNGFEEVQHAKLRNAQLANFFQSVTTAEAAGVAKPDPRIFHKALDKAKATAQASLYVGDHREVDGSALRVGMDFIWYNPADYAPESSVPLNGPIPESLHDAVRLNGVGHLSQLLVLLKG